MEEIYDIIYEKYNNTPFTEKEKRGAIEKLLSEADGIFLEAESELQKIDEKIDLILKD